MRNRRGIRVLVSLIGVLLVFFLMFLQGCAPGSQYEVKVVNYQYGLNPSAGNTYADIGGAADAAGWAGVYTEFGDSSSGVSPYLYIYFRSEDLVSGQDPAPQDHTLTITSQTTLPDGSIVPNLFSGTIDSLPASTPAGWTDMCSYFHAGNPTLFYDNCNLALGVICANRDHVRSNLFSRVSTMPPTNPACFGTERYLSQASPPPGEDTHSRAESTMLYRLIPSAICQNKGVHDITVTVAGAPGIYPAGEPRSIHFVLDMNWDHSKLICNALGCSGIDPSKPNTWDNWGVASRGGNCCGPDANDDPDMGENACAYCFKEDNQPTGAPPNLVQKRYWSYSPVMDSAGGACCGDDVTTPIDSAFLDCGNVFQDGTKICADTPAWGWKTTTGIGDVWKPNCLANAGTSITVADSYPQAVYCGTGSLFTPAPPIPLFTINSGAETRAFKKYGVDTPNPNIVGGNGMLCSYDTNRAASDKTHIAECCGDSPAFCKTPGAHADHLTSGGHAIANDGAAEPLWYYCKGNHQFSTDLDTSQSDCQLAGLHYAGGQCCGEQEDSRNIGYESYNGDTSGACFKSTYQQRSTGTPQFLRFDHDGSGIQTLFYEVIISPTGTFEGCAIDTTGTLVPDNSGVEYTPGWRSSELRGKPYNGNPPSSIMTVDPNHPASNDFLLAPSPLFPYGFPDNPDAHGGKNTMSFLSSWVIDDNAYCEKHTDRFCSYAEVWRPLADVGADATDQLHLGYTEWDMPPGRLQAECCPAEACWDGGAGSSGECVPASDFDDPNEPSRGSAPGYRCRIGSGGVAEWVQAEPKYAPRHIAWGYCPQKDQCLFGNPLLPSPPLTCVEPGFFWGDYICSVNASGVGDWASRNRDLGMAMLRVIGETEAGGLFSHDYTLYCSDLSDAVNMYNYVVGGLPMWSTTVDSYLRPAHDLEDDTHIAGLRAVEKVCVIRRGSNPKEVYVGIALNSRPNLGNQTVPESDDVGILRSLGLFLDPVNHYKSLMACKDVIEQNEEGYHECSWPEQSERGVWLNPRMNTIIFAWENDEPIPEVTDQNLISLMIEWLINFIYQIVEKIISIIESELPSSWEQDIAFIEQSRGGDMYYMASKGPLHMYASLERRYEPTKIEGGTDLEFTMMELSGFPEEGSTICDTIYETLGTMQGGAYCARDVVTGNYHIVSRNEISGSIHGLAGLWQQLTGSLRLDDSTVPRPDAPPDETAVLIKDDADTNIVALYDSGNVITSACMIEGIGGCSSAPANSLTIYNDAGTRVIAYIAPDGSICAEEGSCEGHETTCDTADSALIVYSDTDAAISINNDGVLCFIGEINP